MQTSAFFVTIRSSTSRELPTSRLEIFQYAARPCRCCPLAVNAAKEGRKGTESGREYTFRGPFSLYNSCLCIRNKRCWYSNFLFCVWTENGRVSVGVLNHPAESGTVNTLARHISPSRCNIGTRFSSNEGGKNLILWMRACVLLLLNAIIVLS